MRAAVAAVVLLVCASGAGAQTISQRGFMEADVFGFPQETANDVTKGVGDVLLRESRPGAGDQEREEVRRVGDRV